MSQLPISPESACDPIAVKHARDLDVSGRDWLQRLFGRPLRDDEDVTIVLSAPHVAPSGSDKRSALARLERVLDKSAANMHGISEQAFDEAVGEAMRHVRPTFEP
jgi:hypothetical protein